MTEQRYGHRRDGEDCVYEVCGTGRNDPCTYTPAEIAEFEREAEKEWQALVEKERTAKRCPGCGTPGCPSIDRGHEAAMECDRG